MKIIITESAVLTNGDISFNLFEKFGKVKIFSRMTYKELEKEIPDTDVLLCNKITVDRNILERAKRLVYIGTFATGYDNIDINICRKRNITVCNAGSYSTNAVAQQTFGYILNHFCKISEYNTFVKSGGWKKSPVFSPIVFQSYELAGKTIGIIGYGSIGRAVAKLAQAFGMNVLAFTRTAKEDAGVKFVSFEQLIGLSDIVTAHCPLNSESAGMFSAEAFAKFKDGAFFVNTARGGLVDEQALFDALESGKLSGAAVDVLAQEPMNDSCVLMKAKNITITPHSSWLPFETRKRLIKIVADNLEAFLSGNPINVV